MPFVTITHATSYRNRTADSLGPHRLMLRPRQIRDVSLSTFDLEISPEARIDWSHDVADNAIATAQFDTRTESLSIRSRAQVELRAPAWPVFPIAAYAASFPFQHTVVDRTDPWPLATRQCTDHAGRLPLWAEEFVMGRPTDTLFRLKTISNGISSRITYQSRETEGTQGPLETLDRGWGSCRDFADRRILLSLGEGPKLRCGTCS